MGKLAGEALGVTTASPISFAPTEIPTFKPTQAPSTLDPAELKSSCMNDCSGHGACGEATQETNGFTGVCACEGGWLNDDCSVFAIDYWQNGRASEVADNATVTMKLQADPSGPVTCKLRSADTTEVTLEPASVTLTSTAESKIDATGVKDVEDDGDTKTQIFLTSCTSSDPRFNFDKETVIATITNVHKNFPSANAVQPSNVGTSGSNTARRRQDAGGQPGGGQVTVTGQMFDPDAQVIVANTDVSIPPDIRTTVTNSDGTVSEVQARTPEVINWQNAGVSAILASADRKRRASQDGRRRLLDFHGESVGHRRRALQDIDPRDLKPAQFWNEYLNTVVRTYETALEKGTVFSIEPHNSPMQSAATYTQQAAQERMSKGHKLTEADRHTCDAKCTHRRRQGALVEKKNKAAGGDVSVETVPSNAFMKVTLFYCSILYTITIRTVK